MTKARLPRRRDSIVALLVLLSAALLGVRPYAARCADDDSAARGKNKGGTEATRLVTGDPAHMIDVVAGTPPTAVVQVVPVPAKVGSYPIGTTIVGNELRAFEGGFRAWFEFQVFDWDPNGDGVPRADVVIAKLDASGYLDSDAPGDQPDLTSPSIPCATDATCVAAFGESWAKCEGGLCKSPYFTDRLGLGRPDSWCFPGTCLDGFIACSSSPNPACYAVYEHDPKATRPDDGTVKYFATLVLDVPAGAIGKYTVNVIANDTWVAYGGPPPEAFEMLATRGFTVNIILTGQCCYGLGTPNQGCIDGVLRSECGDDEPGPFVFTPDERCPPDGPDCSRHLGACCDTLTAQCEDDIVEASCQGSQRVWAQGTTCGEGACIADTGACCDHGVFGGSCREDVSLSECSCGRCEWTKGGRCADLDCVHDTIPTVSEWGLVILTLSLLTGAKIYFGRRAYGRAG
jgi:hypothetical protein